MLAENISITPAGSIWAVKRYHGLSKEIGRIQLSRGVTVNTQVNLDKIGVTRRLLGIERNNLEI